MKMAATESDRDPSMPLALGTEADDLSREVFGLLGLTIDVLSYRKLMSSIETAAEAGAPCLLSTPNVNFLITSRRNIDFRESLLRSDLCLADGVPLIWIARLIGIPIRERVTGADLFQTLKVNGARRRRLKVFLFGGAEGIAEMVSKSLNVSSVGLECVGSVNPGFGSVEDMSAKEVIDTINSSGADLLAVFLGAEKAQTWLLRNHHYIKIPIRAQFGAAINFEAGTVKRAPAILRNSGLEWLWRIKEEPYLWRRYWNDGWSLIRLMLTSVVPLLLSSFLVGRFGGRSRDDLQLSVREECGTVVLSLSGNATSNSVAEAIPQFRYALKLDRDIRLDCENVVAIDPRFLGLLLMVRKRLVNRGRRLILANAAGRVRRELRLNGFGFLLSHGS